MHTSRLAYNFPPSGAYNFPPTGAYNFPPYQGAYRLPLPNTGAYRPSESSYEEEDEFNHETSSQLSRFSQTPSQNPSQDMGYEQPNELIGAAASVTSTAT